MAKTNQRVSVDNDKCVGCGLCVSLCEQGFELKNNKAVVKNPNAPCIKEAADSCPMNAIIIK